MTDIMRIQDRFLNIGWRWIEEIFNELPGRECSLKFTLSKQPMAFEVASPTYDAPYGWGRGPRAQLWLMAEAWLLDFRNLEEYDARKLKDYYSLHSVIYHIECMVPNLDVMDISDLEQFVKRIDNNKLEASRTLFPSRNGGYLKYTKMLRDYASELTIAKRLRARGLIEDAQFRESRAQEIYNKLPPQVRW